jgi:hypothetical protein
LKNLGSYLNLLKIKPKSGAGLNGTAFRFKKSFLGYTTSRLYGFRGLHKGQAAIGVFGH